jgi:hypothetical protein
VRLWILPRPALAFFGDLAGNNELIEVRDGTGQLDRESIWRIPELSLWTPGVGAQVNS